MIHELRIYHCAPGRMHALLKRFNDVTLDFWKKYGIRQIGFWTVTVGSSNHDLYYMLQWDSVEERQRLWNAFMSDPEWLEARAESEKDGPILTGVTNMLLEPTAFSVLR